jgi:addiction module HigA family antidote
MQHTLPKYSKVKGVHPGAVLKRELTKRNVKAIELANAIDEYPQTINAITKEKRGINPKLSIKLSDYFNIEKEYFMLLQASFEVKSSLQESNENPLIGKVRSSLFWDVDFDKLNIEKNSRFIIQRILERGNESEINELVKLYGKATIKTELSTITNSISPDFDRNVNRYILEKA